MSLESKLKQWKRQATVGTTPMERTLAMTCIYGVAEEMRKLLKDIADDGDVHREIDDVVKMAAGVLDKYDLDGVVLDP